MSRAGMPATSCCRVGLAEPATPALVRELAKRDLLARRQEAKTTDDARSIARRVEALELRFDVNAGPTGSLFGSVTATNVADRLWEQEKIRVDRRKLSMDTIKRVGRYTVSVELFADVVAELKLAVAPEGQELPTEDELAEAEAEAEASEAAAAEAAAAESAAAEAAVAAAVEDVDDELVEPEAEASKRRPTTSRTPSTSPSPTSRKALRRPVCPQASPPVCGQRFDGSSTVSPQPARGWGK